MSRSCIALSLIVIVAMLQAPYAVAQEGSGPLPATAWLLQGNAPAAGSFLGTSNNRPIIFRTDGKEAMRIVPGGYIGIGTNAPTGPLTVSQNDPNQGNAIAATTAGNTAAGIIAEGSGNQGYGVYAVSFGPGSIAVQGYNAGSTGNAGNFYMDNPNMPDNGSDLDAGANASVYAATAAGNPLVLPLTGFYGHAGAFFSNNTSNQSATLYAQGNGLNNAVMGYDPGPGNNPPRAAGVWGETYNGFAVYGQADGGGYAAYFSATDRSACSFSGAPGWDCETPSRLMKKHAEAVDPKNVLRQLAAMPVPYYGMVGQRDPAVRYLGPSAEDFKAAFGLGTNDTTINTANAEGVALVAIQGLYRELQSRDERIAALEAENRALKADVDARLTALEQRLSAGAQQAALASREQP